MKHNFLTTGTSIQKKILFAAFVLVFFSPFSVFAETGKPYARYCSDPTDIFTGIAHETEYTPKITVKVDFAVNEKTLK